MFKLKYRIVEIEFEIRNISPEEFDSNHSNLYGMVELNFNGNVIGYHHSNEISNNEISLGCFQDYSITRWIDILLDLLILLENNKCVIISELESDNWFLEFKKGKKNLNVRHIKAKNTHIDKNTSVTIPYIYIDRLEYIFHYKHRGSVKKEIEILDCDWGPISIETIQFYEEILNNTHLLLHDVSNTYENIYISKTILEIKNKMKLLKSES
ncbi:MAG: hypothetical protein Q3M24_11165 [Candidatus Electrothrix aestuarii]|uniref:Uncharacterized protein n=1 Tax=Candidatus Electrothrix aestuarii TaxID=3062594 RepID=A0AAU8M1G0_9BACT|nr:hypothetical protein [Candidatus Electrothrix aestuarii]